MSLPVATSSDRSSRDRRWSDVLIVALVPVALVSVTLFVISPPNKSRAEASNLPPSDAAPVIEDLNQQLSLNWTNVEIQPAEQADDLQVLRRLSLSLHGTIPSLEEVRAFEADDEPERLERWALKMLDDTRFADYFAERLARAYVGTDGGQFLVYRRDRLVDWLSEQIQKDVPYDQLVAQLISDQGLWTGEPATNFVMHAYANDELDENKLAGRVVRAFLGQRIDCAQCHDHPFDPRWKQSHFEGLASFFGQTQLSLIGVEDKTQKDGEEIVYTVEDRETLEQVVVDPAVPFGEAWLPAEGSRRSRLAAWVTHPENERFGRATANRMWGLLFGRPYYGPVDDIPDSVEGEPDLLDSLASDWAAHDRSLKRLLLIITASDAFRARSDSSDEADLAQLREDEWALFPLGRLRPEQVVGSMLQASSIRTIDQNSHLFTRIRRFTSENEFVQEYGDLGENELDEHTGTLPQALQRMNGKLVAESIKTGILTASSSIESFSQTDAECVENSFLTCLTRRPNEEELQYFTDELREAGSENERKRIVEDLFWSLFNSPEFAWNH